MHCVNVHNWCDACGRSFGSTRDLRLHRSRIHSKWVVAAAAAVGRPSGTLAGQNTDSEEVAFAFDVVPEPVVVQHGAQTSYHMCPKLPNGSTVRSMPKRRRLPRRCKKGHPCDVCSKTFKTRHGCRIHRAKAHSFGKGRSSAKEIITDELCAFDMVP